MQRIIIFSNVTYNRSDLVHTAFRQCDYLAALAAGTFNDARPDVELSSWRRWLLRDGNNRIDIPVYLNGNAKSPSRRCDIGDALFGDIRSRRAALLVKTERRLRNRCIYSA